MKRAKGEGIGWESVNLNQMIFVQSMSMMKRFLDDRLLQMQGLEAEGTQTTGSSGELAGRLPIRGHAKDIATQMAYFGLGSVRTDCHLATDNKGHGIAPFLLV